MRCDHAYDDGAYVLGALSPGERAAYERHLATCPFCREAVAEIAVLPGLLGRLDPADFADLAAPTERSRLPRVINAATNERRRTRRGNRLRYSGTLAAAACLALVIGIGADALRGTSGSGEGTQPVAGSSALALVAMQPVAEAVPVTAKVGLTPEAFGTEVTMECAYEETGTEGKNFMFRLVAHGTDGTTEQLGSWWAGPGDEVALTGTTHYTGDELERLELIRSDDTPLLTYSVT